MTTKIAITALLTLVSIVGKCAQIKSDTITVCFQLTSKTKGESATVVYPDFVSCNSVALHPITDGNGQWTLKIPTNNTLHIQIWDDNKIKGVVWGALNLFCRPGTKASILLDDLNNQCVFTGENAEAHQAQITHPLKIENFHGQMFNMDMQEAATNIRNVYKQNLHRIDTLCAANPNLPSRYIEGLRTIARYGYAMDMTQNVNGHYAESLAQIIENGNKLPKEYLDLFHEAETQNLLHPQGLLSCEATTYFSDVICLEYIARNGIIHEARKQKGDYLLNDFKSTCSMINKIDASTEVKQMMKTSQFLRLFETEMTPKRKNFLRNQLTTDAFGQFQSYLNGMKAKFETIPEVSSEALADSPIDSLIDGKDIFHKLIAPYRGRVIYIDVWGSWCGPCIREMEHIPQLHETLNGLPVTYMYLANNTPEELWQKTAKRFGLKGKDCLNLRLPDNQQHAVEDYLGVVGFPTFLIVDPDGNIVTNKAPRPSNADSLCDSIKNESTLESGNFKVFISSYNQ